MTIANDYQGRFVTAFRQVTDNMEIISDLIDTLSKSINYLSRWADDVVIEYDREEENFYIHPIFSGSSSEILTFQEDFIRTLSNSICVYYESVYSYHPCYRVEVDNFQIWLTLI